jgi:hypothetical protein
MTKSDKDPLGIGKLPRWQQISIFLLLMIFGIGGVEFAKSIYRDYQAPTNEIDAQKRMLGTWTYTQPINFSDDPFPFKWVKWEIRPDGTMTSWNANPTDDDWGQGVSAKYQIVTGKFSTNGERWFGIADPENGYTVGVFESGSIVLHMLPAANRKTGTMVRGDKNPFRK